MSPNIIFPRLVASPVKEGKFKAYSDVCCKFNWLVIGRRQNIQVVVNKSDVRVGGNGPYKWIH